MNEIININTNINNTNNTSLSNINKIQKNLIMMEFDIEMINKIILYFNIESENQAIDYLTKNADGLWRHPFIPKINDEINDNINEKDTQEKDKNSIPIIVDMKSKINTIKNKGITNIIYYPMNDQLETKELYCEICGEAEKFHININNDNQINKINIKEDLIEEDKKNDDDLYNTNDYFQEDIDNNLKIINNNNNINIVNKNDVNINIDNKECPICLGDIENKVELENCHHKFCYECFNNYLIDLINKNNIEKIPCPVNTCFNKDIKEDFFHKYLTEEQYFKYRTFRSKNEIDRDPKKMFCPLCSGYALIEEDSKYKYDPNDPKYIKSTMTCVNGHNFCSCGIALHEGDCYRDTNDFQKYLIKEHVKQCPKCGFYIKKLKGCNHMTCGNALCKYEFCWLCMNEAVPGHFEYGECKGMQFIDPNSFMFKLKRKNPFMYRILAFFISLIYILMILFIFLFVPSFIIIIAFLYLLATNNLPFRNYLRLKSNKKIKLLYLLTISLIIISLQSIAHFLIICLIIILFLFFIMTLIYSFSKMIYRICKRLCMRN